MTGKKGLFLMQRRFAILGHAIALNLKEKFGWSDFCGYVYLRSSYDYLQNQKDVSYTELLLDEDIHEEYRHEKLDLDYITHLEKEYGIPNLWPFVTVDRIIMHNQLVREYPYNTPPYSHEEMLKILQVTAKKIIKLFDEQKPDYVFMSVVGAIGSSLIYYIAKKRGIPVLNAVIGRINNLFLLSDNYQDLSGADVWFDKFEKGLAQPSKKAEAEKILTDFRAKPVTYYEQNSVAKQAVSRAKQLSFLEPRNFVKSAHWFAAVTKEYFAGSIKNDYQTTKPWLYLWDRTKRKARSAIGFDDLYDAPVEGEKFAFFPLHFDPEIATMLYAPFYSDQLYVIKQIARSLPISYKLYVKEHPSMAGYRPRSFYKEMKKMPNVKLINPNVTSYELVKKAAIITTITGTTGWEGALLGKPVVTFGEVYYNKLSAVKRCRAIEELPAIIKERLEHFKYDEKNIVNYLAAMLEDGIDVPFLQLWEKEIGNFAVVKEKIAPIADLIYKKMLSKA